MKYTITFFLLLYNLSASTLFAQENEWAEEENNTSKFFIGVNVGAIFPNSNTATIYTGTNDITPFGIDYIMNIPENKTTFDAYFKNPYYVAEYPQKPVYKPALNIGLHAGINLGKGNTLFTDLNFSTVKYEQTFTMAIDDPNNQSVDPTYEQFPIIGEEKRFNLNIGTQLSLFNEESINIYWSFFGNFNSIKLEQNYIVIDNKQYNIIHSSMLTNNQQPGGIGYGGGTGLGLKYKLTDNISTDLTYNFYYTKTKMNDFVQSFGMQHGIMFRVIWN
ncbi:MAG: hypothetical protein RQ875_09640 [Vicingaceae bacterium]|nr:hypothetical protein [Vicingaceae bacterium]